jgi:hypothetical protein
VRVTGQVDVDPVLHGSDTWRLRRCTLEVHGIEVQEPVDRFGRDFVERDVAYRRHRPSDLGSASRQARRNRGRPGLSDPRSNPNLHDLRQRWRWRRDRFGGFKFLIGSIAPATRLKSTSTSARSAGASTNRVTGTGLSHNPPSAPICHILVPGTLRFSMRALQPFRTRKRYAGRRVQRSRIRRSGYAVFFSSVLCKTFSYTSM